MKGFGIKRMMALASVAATVVLASSSIAQAQYNQFVGFGDSTLDSGWWRGAFAGQCAGLGSPCTSLNPARDTRIANALANGGNGSPVGVGQMHSEVLAGMFGLTAAPINQPGGTNYAISGSLTAELGSGAGNVSPNLILPATTQQISNYLAANPTANSNALYMIGTGSNDISWAAANLAAGTRQGFLNNQIAQLVSSVAALHAAGAEHFIVNGVQNTSPLGLYYNARLQQELTLAGIDFTYVDVAAFIAEVTANPAAYGYTPATVLPGIPGPTTGSACVAGAGAEGWGQFCANTTTPSPPGTPYARLRSLDAQETSFFADDGHLSASGQRWLAEYEYSLLAPAVPEASTWAMMLLGFAGIGLGAYRRSRSEMLRAS